MMTPRTAVSKPAVVVLACLALAACGAPPGDPVFGSGAPEGTGAAAWQTARYPSIAADGYAHIYFTRPGTERNGGEDPEADDAIVRIINSAQSSVDLCLYEFSRRPIIDAAVLAVQRGVRVRFAGDGDEYHDEGYEELAEAGVELALRKPRDRIMHNKFGVVDDTYVFTGSMNLSENGTLRNNNHLMRLQSPELAALYSAEFQQMYDERLFGRKKNDTVGGGDVSIAGRQVSVWFSPQDDVDKKLRAALATADHSVHFMIFSFTHKDVRDDLIALHDRGVEVVGIFDESQARGRYSVDEALADRGVPTLIDGNHNATGFAGGKLHHKVMLIDAGTDSDPMVLGGSYNWSNNATRYNDENFYVLRGADYVAPFVEEFCLMLEQATPHPRMQGTIPDTCARIDRTVRINEVLAAPDGSDSRDEFVEIVNAGDHAINLSGWTLGDEVKTARHTFPVGTIVNPQSMLTVFAGGEGRAKASSGRLGLNNTADEVTLRDQHGVVMDRVRYRKAIKGVSFNRADDGAAHGPFERHDALSDAPSSANQAIASEEPDTADDPAEPSVHINEVLPNPDGSDRGQEFVELVNSGSVVVDLSGWHLGDIVSPTRHVFEAGATLEPGKAVTVYDRGDHGDIPGAITSSSGNLSLNNTHETLTLRNAEGAVVHEVSYAKSKSGVSLNCGDDGQAACDLKAHDEVTGDKTSPGRRADGSAW